MKRHYSVNTEGKQGQPNNRSTAAHRLSKQAKLGSLKASLISSLAFIGICILCCTLDCSAVVLTNGNWVTLKGTNSAAQKELAGRVVKDEIRDFEIRDSAGNLLFKGQIQDRIVKSRMTGKLHFIQRIRNTKGGLPGAVIKVTRKGFRGYSTDVNYRTDGLGNIGPTGATRDGTGDEVAFIFSIGKMDHPEWIESAVPSGSDSKFFHVVTNATNYNRKGVTTIYAGGGKVDLISYSPIP